MRTMEFTKQECAAIAPAGYQYAGFSYATGRYAYQRKTATGYAMMVCEPEDMTAKNLAFMAKHNLSRTVRRGDLA